MKKFVTFVLVGGCGLLLNLGISYLLTDILGLWYFVSFVIATLVTWTAIFFANSCLTFAGHSQERYMGRYIKFIVGYLGIFIFNASLVFLLTSVLHVHYLISITISSAITSIFTFIFSSKYVYND